MTLKMSKTKEIVFHRPYSSKFSLPDVLCDVMPITGYFLVDTLNITENVQQTNKLISFIMCMSGDCLSVVSDAVILSKLFMYRQHG